MGHFTKLQTYNVPVNNVQLAKRQVKQVSFSHSPERQQGIRISYLGWQTVPGAHRYHGERSVTKCGIYVELTTVAASDRQQNADDNEQQRWMLLLYVQ